MSDSQLLAKTTNKIYDEDIIDTTDDFSLEDQLKLSKVFTDMGKVKYNLVKNPFVCRSDFEVRVSLDKDPRNNKGNTDFCDLYKTEEGAIHLINNLDDKSSYDFGKNNRINIMRCLLLINMIMNYLLII